MHGMWVAESSIVWSLYEIREGGRAYATADDRFGWLPVIVALHALVLHDLCARGLMNGQDALDHSVRVLCPDQGQHTAINCRHVSIVVRIYGRQMIGGPSERAPSRLLLARGTCRGTRIRSCRCQAAGPASGRRTGPRALLAGLRAPQPLPVACTPAVQVAQTARTALYCWHTARPSA